MENKLHFWFMQFMILGVSLNLKAELVSAAPKFPCYFIFGDSLVDNGNNNNLNTSAKVNYLPYGIDFPQGPTGRFTNGKNLADFIAELLGFEKYIPPLANASNQDIITGVNYGSGAAGILDESGATMGDVITFNEQISNHKEVISRIAASVGSERSAKQHLKKCIYSVVIGNNDYLNNYYLPASSSSSKYTPEEFAELLIRHYSEQLRQLYKYGARKIAVFALGRLGCCPGEVALYGADESNCVDTINDAVQIFNDKLKRLVFHLNLLFFTSADFIYIDATPDSYGNITDIIHPCCALNDIGHCLPESATCDNRENYMFWDGFHPTEAGNSLSAKKAYDFMSPLFTNLIDVE